MALFAPVSGIEGRVNVLIDDVATTIAGIDQWKMVKNTAPVIIPNFESPSDGDGNYWPEILPGYSTGKVTFQGQYDTGNPEETAYQLYNGAYAFVDLILIKETPFGFPGVPIFIESIEIGSNFNNQYATFSCSASTTGVVDQAGVIEG